MPLTPAQLTTFKADLDANTNQVIIDALAIGNNNGIVDWYNLDASPAFTVYKNLVPLDEVSNAIELDDVANITSADSDRLIKFYALRPEGVFANKASDRVGFDDVFSAAAGDDSQQALIALWKKLATNIEKLFAAGTGTDGDPAVMGFEGPVSLQDVRDAIALS